MRENTKQSLIRCFQCLHFLATQEIATSKYPDLRSFLVDMGIGFPGLVADNAKYTSPEIANEMVTSMAEVVRDTFFARCKQSALKMSAGEVALDGAQADDEVRCRLRTDRSLCFLAETTSLVCTHGGRDD